MSNQNPNDPNNLSLQGGSSGSTTSKPGFENLSGGSSTAQSGGGTGAKPGFENLSGGSSTTQGAGGTGGSTYTVQKGDSLSAIAKQHMGSANKWRELYDANREVIGDNPDKIFPGQELTIPASSGE